MPELGGEDFCNWGLGLGGTKEMLNSVVEVEREQVITVRRCRRGRTTEVLERWMFENAVVAAAIAAISRWRMMG